ncbi:ABC transporter permease subunit [Cryobacterium sp. Sr8]|uniref:NitT/TauT family transport system permease protein n=1 Tax=Cryobacterium psychrotolerans TaxID=386301 RepID=A0A1G9EMY8_9MICO|nr:MULTISPECIES: ABC transporter permease subunit [Cryobacterium]TFD42030.1 ABC transporter permease subunit [Cryobacterium sp. TMT1-2-1]TFD76349.1 ABC transporter permease subunit [Cryobacterium sp. Sr8]TFD83688.1 ABC transporter permease subunit [Cryobacterium psychrotolerans]SDK77567.1 NitT/TauT family transport system permease protein [Cryobacterium psychrotolerans]
MTRTAPPAQPAAAGKTRAPRGQARRGQVQLRRIVTGALGLVVLAALWELYKLLGPADGVVVGGTTLLPRTSDLAMPHLWVMAERVLEPVTGAAAALPLWLVVLQGSMFTLGIAAVGWLVGVTVGLLLALLMQRFRLAESAVLPWIVLSQTVPLIALAPLVRRWGSQIEIGDFSWESWMSVALIASYLAFFPVSVGALRGLASPDANHVDLMHCYAAGWWKTLWRLRLPASVGYLLPALRLAAASAVIGTVVAEVSIGLRGGIGRLIVEYAGAAGGDPGKPWAPIFGSIAVGLLAAGFVGLIGLFLRRFRRGEVAA